MRSPFIFHDVCTDLPLYCITTCSAGSAAHGGSARREWRACMRDEAAARLDDYVVQAVACDQRLLQSGERFELLHAREQPVVVAGRDRVVAAAVFHTRRAVLVILDASARIVARSAEQHRRVSASGIIDELRVEVEEPVRRPARDEEGDEERERQAAEHCACVRIEHGERRGSEESSAATCLGARRCELRAVNCGLRVQASCLTTYSIARRPSLSVSAVCLPAVTFTLGTCIAHR